MDALTGLILAGGRSRRFGSDKSRFELPDGRGDMLQRGLAMLRALPGLSRVAVSCREDQAEAMARRLPQGVELLIDPPHESSSPLFGVTAALRRWPGPALLLSCDLPLMDEETLRQLCDARDAARAGTCGVTPPAMPEAVPPAPPRAIPGAQDATPAVPPATPTPDAVPHATPGACASPPCSPQPLPPLRTAFIHPDGTVETLVSICEAESLSFLEAALTAGRLGLYAAIPAERQLLIPVRDSLPFLNMNTPEDADKAALCLKTLIKRPSV